MGKVSTARKHTLEAFFAFTTIAIDIICAGAIMLTRIGFTLIVVHVTIGSSPAWLTFTLVPK